MPVLRCRVICGDSFRGGEKVSYEGENTVHSDTDADPYGTGTEKYPVSQCNKN